jgi:hypothetical protein
MRLENCLLHYAGFCDELIIDVEGCLLSDMEELACDLEHLDLE